MHGAFGFELSLNTDCDGSFAALGPIHLSHEHRPAFSSANLCLDLTESGNATSLHKSSDQNGSRFQSEGHLLQGLRPAQLRQRRQCRLHVLLKPRSGLCSSHWGTCGSCKLHRPSPIPFQHRPLACGSSKCQGSED